MNGFEYFEIGRGRPSVRLGTIYYVACDATLRLKIGYTAGSPEKRIKSLQTGSPGQLRLISAHPGTREDEAALHQHFAAKRLHGEWFEMDQELFDHICFTIWNYAAMLVKLPELGAPPPWLSLGLQMLELHTGEPVPEEMRAFI